MGQLKRTLYGTVAMIVLAGFAPTAHAGDMAVKAPLATAPESLLSGITVYGQMDVNGTCQNHGLPYSGTAAVGMAYFLVGEPQIDRQVCSLGNNGITQSLIGVKIEKAIGYGFTAIGQVETGFNPASGEISNAVGSVAKQNNSFYAGYTTFGDGGRNGQLFNGPTFAGLSSPIFGTLTAGRISTLQRDNVLSYDPQGGAYAFSMIGFFGAFAGMGQTEDAYWDNAVKYVYDNGPFHFGAAATSGSAELQNQGAYAFDVGLRNILGGLSVDAAYGHTKDMVGASPFGACASVSAGTGCPAVSAPNTQLLPGVGSEMQLMTKISDATAWSVQGKYVFNLPGWGSAPMDTKAAPAPATLTIYAGYEHIDQGDPSNLVVNGTPMMLNYIQGNVNNFGFVTDKLVDIFWVGGKYAVNNWTVTGAYYNQHQNNWEASSVTGVNSGIGNVQAVNPASFGTCTNDKAQAPKAGANSPVFTISSNCAGTYQAASFVVDYAFNKFVDIYSGVQYNWTNGGFNSAAQWDSQITGVTGLRLKF
jgi:predicted porin